MPRKKAKLREEAIGLRMVATVLLWARLSLNYSWSKKTGNPAARGQASLRGFSKYLQDQSGEVFDATAISGYERGGQLSTSTNRLLRINRAYIATIYSLPTIAPPYPQTDLVSLTNGILPQDIETIAPIQDLIEALRLAKKRDFQSFAEKHKVNLEDLHLASFGIFLHGAEAKIASMLGRSIDDILKAGLAQLYKAAIATKIDLGLEESEQPRSETPTLLNRIKADCQKVLENGDRDLLEKILGDILQSKPQKYSLEQIAGMRAAGEVLQMIRGDQSPAELAEALGIEVSIVEANEAAGTIQSENFVAIADNEYIKRLSDSGLIFEWDRLISLQSGKDARQWITLTPLSQLLESQKLLDFDFDQKAKRLALSKSDLANPVYSVLGNAKENAIALLLEAENVETVIHAAIAEIYRKALMESRQVWETLKS